MSPFQRFVLTERLGRLIIPLGAASIIAGNSLYSVDGGERAIIFDRIQGVKKKVLGEGLHFLIPWLQRAIIFDIRTQPRAITTTTGSKDMQTVQLTLRILHRPSIEHLSEIYKNLGPDYDERVLPSIGNEVLKATVAQFDASELITQREIVSAKIRDELVKRAADFHIMLEDVSLTHLAFGKEFTKAVEEKQVAQQEAERARFIVEKAEQEKTAAVIRGQAESTAAKLISDAMEKHGSGFVELRKIEAAKEIASSLSNSKNIVYLPSGQSLLINASTL
jgi:prohibitin 1